MHPICAKERDREQKILGLEDWEFRLTEEQKFEPGTAIYFLKSNTFLN
jgi:hypothetical protein